MELLNPQFVLICIKLAIGVIPVVLGVALLLTDEEKRRALRGGLCNRLFGVGNAIPMPKFNAALIGFASLAILFGLAATWFLVLSSLFEK